MTEYYEEKLRSGTLYQDFVVMAMFKRGWPIMQLCSKVAQYTIGESIGGVEVKNDCRWEQTGNLYIEVFEKSRGDNSRYERSGIQRDDNSLLWIVGNRRKAWVFAKKHLLAEYENCKLSTRMRKTPTSIGFVLPLEEADRLCAWTVEFDDADRAAIPEAA